MKSSLSLAVVGLLVSAATAQANWFDSVFRAPQWNSYGTPVETVSAGTVTWGGAKGEVIVEEGCGMEKGCGCHWRPFSGSLHSRCCGWMGSFRPTWFDRGCGCGAKAPSCAVVEKSCGCGWSLPRIQLPKLPHRCGCRKWHVSFTCPVRIHRHSCGCGMTKACGCGASMGEWKESAIEAPMPVNPPKPIPDAPKPAPKKAPAGETKA